MDCIFACDAGTSAVKAALVSPKGTVFCERRASVYAKPSAAEYLHAFFSLFIEMRLFAQEKKLRIAGICISGNGPSLVSVTNVRPYWGEGPETKFSPLYDELLLWNENPLYELFLSDAETAFFESLQNSGSIFLPRIFLLVKKLAAEKMYTPHVFLPLPEYISWVLTGNAVCFLPESRYQKAYWFPSDIQRLEEFFNENETIFSKSFSLPEIMPPFAPTGTIIGQFKSIPVIAGAPDFFAALAGTKTITPLSACDRAGSTEGLNVCIGVPPENAAPFRLLPSVIEPNWNISVLLGRTGHFFKLYSRCQSEHDELCSFFETLNTAIAKLEAAAGTRLAFTLSGGQALNRDWNQLKAEQTNRCFLVPQTVNGELLGDAIFGFTALQYFSDFADAAQSIVHITQSFEPR